MKLKLLRPTVDTPFHIDWNWFDRNNLNAQGVIRNQLCYSCQQRFFNHFEPEEIDYIDPTTGEVFRMDNLREAILAHCQWEPDYIDEDTPLVQAIFRLFLANNNQPLTAKQLAQRLHRQDSDAILRMLTAGGVKNGIVPMKA